jgi:hypothetical protein
MIQRSDATARRLAWSLVVLLLATGGWHGAADAGQPTGESPAQVARPTLTPEPTTGPPRPTLTPEAEASHEHPSAALCLRLTVPTTLAPGAVTSYQFVVRNDSRGRAKPITVTLPFAADIQQVVDVSFSDPDAWVSALFSETVQLRLPALPGGTVVTATFRLRTADTAALGRILTTRAQLHQGDTLLVSNRMASVVSISRVDDANAQLTVEPFGKDEDTGYLLSYDGFASEERVSLWIQKANGDVTSLGIAQANRGGAIAVSLRTASLEAGEYRIVAYASCSDLTAIGRLIL